MRRFDKWRERDNFKRELIEGAELVGAYELPRLRATRETPRDLVPFNAAMTQREPENKWLHFFIDDYQFERLWNAPRKYLPLLRRFEGVITPDFSMYLDMPRAQQIWNCYRNRALAYWMQREGLRIVPNVCFGDADSLNWCFDGLPEGGTLAVSTTGALSETLCKWHLLNGLLALLERLRPETLVVHGRMPEAWRGIGQHTQIVVFEGYAERLKRGIMRG